MEKKILELKKKELQLFMEYLIEDHEYILQTKCLKITEIIEKNIDAKIEKINFMDLIVLKGLLEKIQLKI